MKTTRRTTILLTLVLFAAPMAVLATGTADSGTRWLHVRVVDRSDEGESVRVNLPLDLIASILPEIDIEPHIRDGRVMLDPEQGVQLGDLRAIWTQVRQAADGEYVRAEASDGNVVVRRAGTLLEIDVQDGPEGTEKVRVRAPLAVLDALFSAPEGEIDLAAAITALAEAGIEDLVLVEDGESSVRIWIDDRPEAP